MRDKRETTPDRQQPRWATRQEALNYSKMGSTTLNSLMQRRRVTAKKLGHKVVVDLNSIDAYYESLPDVSKTAKSEA
jgi:hypothetical protein